MGRHVSAAQAQSMVQNMDHDTATSRSLNKSAYDTRCEYWDYHYEIATSVICAMCLIFGVVYSLFGYRCFKAVMFLTGFIFASIVVYLICLEEDLLPIEGNAGVALGAGILFGLITMLVQYVGLFMTGFHLGLFVGVIVLMFMEIAYHPSTIWISLGTIFGSGLIFATLTLQWQKLFTIIGTSVFGGAMIAVSVDYFIEKFIMVYWVWDRVRVQYSQPVCWFSWLIFSIWPFMLLIGTFIQIKATSRGFDHRDLMVAKKRRKMNVQRIRTRESPHQRHPWETREKRLNCDNRKYRYLYQVRRANGDIISQSYIQSLQRKITPAENTNSLTTLTLQSDHSQRSMNQSESTATSITQVPWIASGYAAVITF